MSIIGKALLFVFNINLYLKMQFLHWRMRPRSY